MTLYNPPPNNIVSGVPFYTNAVSGNFLQSNGTTFNSVQLQGDVIASGLPNNYNGNLFVTGLGGNPIGITDIGLGYWPVFAPMGTTGAASSGNALFMYVGNAVQTGTFNNLFINMELTANAAGAGAGIEVGLFSTPTIPNRGVGGNPTLTKLASTTTFDTLTSGATKGVKNTGAPLSITVSGGTPIWIGVRVFYLTTQPTFTQTGGEVGLRFTEKTTTSAAFSTATTITSNGPSNTGMYAVLTNF